MECRTADDLKQFFAPCFRRFISSHDLAPFFAQLRHPSAPFGAELFLQFATKTGSKRRTLPVG
jgi:hypothetical protein